MHRLYLIIIAIFLINIQTISAQTTTNKMFYKGMNISGAEFNGGRVNAKHFKDYIWPSNKNLEQFKVLGFNTIRVPFAWERMQPNPFNDLNKEEVAELKRIIQKSHMIGLNVIIDPHAYGKYKGKVLELNQLDIKLFTDFWSKLANEYQSYPNVIFGLMNEPYKQSASEWAQFAQVGVDAIRTTGATQLILVPGTVWSGMHSWFNRVGEQSNAEALLTIRDPLNNYAYEMHQYFDIDFSGTHHDTDQNCITADKVIQKFKKTTQWLKENNKKAFLGEFGVQENESCVAVLSASLKFIADNSDVWIGWAYWTAGDWMAKYPYNLFSKDSSNKKRLEVIKRAIN